MASPYVTGLVGLIRSLHPEASVAQVRQILALSSDKVGAGAYGADPYGTCAGCTWEAHYGYGRINVQQALSTAVPPRPPPPPRLRHRPATASARPRRTDTKPRSCTSTRRAAATGRRSACATACRTTAARPPSGSSSTGKTKLLKTFARALRTTDDAVAYWVGFSFAKRGTYRYCVRASDAAGNHSPLACAAIRIR